MKEKGMKGEAIDALNRFHPDVRYMVLYEALEYGAYDPGDMVRRFFTEDGLKDCREAERRGECRIKVIHRVSHGDILPEDLNGKGGNENV